MPIDARVEELLARYPDQLTDSELGELREAGERNPEVEDLMDAIHETESLLYTGASKGEASADDLAAPVALSAGGKRALGRILEDCDDSVATDRNLVDLASRRRSRPLPLAWTALAAGLLLAASALFVVQLQQRGPGDGGGLGVGPATGEGLGADLRLRGDEPGLVGNLEILGSPPWAEGRVRPLDHTVVFEVVLNTTAHLALLETQGGQTHLLHPSPGARWQVDAGSHVVEPQPGASAYRPGAPGTSVYTLVGSKNPIEAGPAGPVPSVVDFVASHEGAVLLDERSILWTAGP